MKKAILISGLMMFMMNFSLLAQNTNDSCVTSDPFCTGVTYNFYAGVNTGSGEAGANYGCLSSTPNPSWFYMRVGSPGNIELYISTLPQHDIDFACWGPFSSHTSPCTSELTAGPGAGSHDSAGPSPYFPSLNMIDCSYSVNWQEWCYIPNAQVGEYYIILITNYSNQACNIIFTQSNIGQPGAGATDCAPLAEISGVVFNDLNENDVLDSGEPGIFGALTGTESAGYYFSTDASGAYTANSTALPDTLYPYFNQPYVQSITPANVAVNGPMTDVNFAVVLTDYSEMSLDGVLFPAVVPGSITNLTAFVQNEGTLANEAVVTIILEPWATFLSSTPSPTSVSGDTLVFSTGVLNPFVGLAINLELDIYDSLLVGSPYEFLMSMNVLNGDSLVANNLDTLTGDVVGSYDPNCKTVFPEGQIENDLALIPQELEYVVHFQNTGTYNASVVRIVDTLSNWLQTPTFDLIASSHPCTYSIRENGIIEFVFTNIQLPPSSVDEPGSHGFVKFSAKVKQDLYNGGNVYNTAHIYFDFNTPIVTNTVLTYTKAATTGIPNVKKPVADQVRIHPNPAVSAEEVIISSAKTITSITVYDANGRIVMTTDHSGAREIKLNVQTLEAGTYMLKAEGKGWSENKVLIVQ